jgi:hypothetical protein
MIRRSIVARPEKSTSIVPSLAGLTAAIVTINLSNRISIAARLPSGTYQPERKAS